jgi:hypothetical protein
MTAAKPSIRMQRRSRLFRCSALLWALVFVLSGVRPAFAATECPHHVGPAHGSADTAAERGATVHAEPDATAHVHFHHAEPSGEPASVPGSHHDLCTCIGPCHAASVAPTPPLASSVLPTAVVYVADAPDAAATNVLPGRASYSLPYATAPPRSG